MVRVRRRGPAPDSIRIDVEDLIDGGRTQLTGGPARDLADGLAAAVGAHRAAAAGGADVATASPDQAGGDPAETAS
jgi:hypothetical protein